MLTEMKFHSDKKGRGVIELTVPEASMTTVVDAIGSVLTLAGHKVRRINDDSKECLSSEEVFPDGAPAMALRGLRAREDITQKELAERLGVSQNAISEMENAKRPISTKLAKRLEKEFGLPYKVFL